MPQALMILGKIGRHPPQHREIFRDFSESVAYLIDGIAIDLLAIQPSEFQVPVPTSDRSEMDP
jgi:hypothetical protein